MYMTMMLWGGTANYIGHDVKMYGAGDRGDRFYLM